MVVGEAGVAQRDDATNRIVAAFRFGNANMTGLAETRLQEAVSGFPLKKFHQIIYYLIQNNASTKEIVQNDSVDSIFVELQTVSKICFDNLIDLKKYVSHLPLQTVVFSFRGQARE